MEVFGAQKQKLLRLSHCLAPALLARCGRGRCGARAEVSVLGLPFHQEELRRRVWGGGESQELRLGKDGAGSKVCGALDTPPRFHDLLKPEFMASDSIGLPTPICLLGPCTPFMLPTLAPPQSPGSLQAQRQARFCSSVARWPSFPWTIGPFC